MPVQSRALSFSKNLFFKSYLCWQYKAIFKSESFESPPTESPLSLGDPVHTLPVNPVDTPFVLATMLTFNQFSTPCSVHSVWRKLTFLQGGSGEKQNLCLVWGIGQPLMVLAKVNTLWLICFLCSWYLPTLAITKRSWAVSWLSLYPLFRVKQREAQNSYIIELFCSILELKTGEKSKKSWFLAFP